MTVDAERKLIYLFTDGACTGNPGPGGWGFILRDSATGHEKEGAGGEAETTNNRMEMLAAIEGLAMLKKPSRVRLISDSQYLTRGLSEWMDKWKAKGWRRGTSPVLNLDLWKRLDALRTMHEIEVQWIRGHRGHPENERCDELAVAEAKKFERMNRAPRKGRPAGGSESLYDDESDA